MGTGLDVGIELQEWARSGCDLRQALSQDAKQELYGLLQGLEPAEQAIVARFILNKMPTAGGSAGLARHRQRRKQCKRIL